MTGWAVCSCSSRQLASRPGVGLGRGRRGRGVGAAARRASASRRSRPRRRRGCGGRLDRAAGAWRRPGRRRLRRRRRRRAGAAVRRPACLCVCRTRRSSLLLEQAGEQRLVLRLGRRARPRGRRDTIWARCLEALGGLGLGADVAGSSGRCWRPGRTAWRRTACTRLGWTPSAAPKSLTGISGRPGTPTWLSTSRGGASLGRPERIRSIMFLALRSEARSGVATTTTSSAEIRVLAHPAGPEVRQVQHHEGRGGADLGWSPPRRPRARCRSRRPGWRARRTG